ncbi:MAG: hypothetical protein FD169_2102 [Bacillota bacterium]|nr:MAG: hypothetical protein FD169_2102 [Bacillota bacterium]MBS3950226.1 hypothetical protein [Peptococcaceae bacterium]
MKKHKKNTDKNQARSDQPNNSTSQQRDKETIELFSEIIDRSCPRK